MAVDMTTEDRNAKPGAALFSVIVLHYNQQKFLEQSLGSVFSQSYPRIELIFADDATPNIDTAMIKSYIEKNRTQNIVNVIYQFSEKNRGTVKNVNAALKAASGKYAMFFAADDMLFDSHVLVNFVRSISSLPADQYVVSGQCVMMDEMLKKEIGKFVNVPLAMSLNAGSPIEQYQKIAFSCFFAMGATAFRMELFAANGYFDEAYSIIEDWSYFLYLTHSGSKIIYSDFCALKHRDGGVSHFNQTNLPPHVIEYKNDSLLIQERLILPFLSTFPLADQVKLMERYETERRCFGLLYTGKTRPSRISIIMQHKVLYIRKFIWWMMGKVNTFRSKCLGFAMKTFPVWVVLRFIKIIAAEFKDDVQLSIVNTAAYDILSAIVLGLFFAAAAGFVCMLLLSAFFFLRQKRKLLFSGIQ